MKPDRLRLLTVIFLLSLARAQQASVPADVPQKDGPAVSASRPREPVQHPWMAPNQPEGLIHLDVVVTDQAGMGVSGLKADDFTVLDKEQSEKVVSFHAYNEADARPDPPVSILLVLDTLHLSDTMAAHERVSVEAFLRQNGGHLARPITVLALMEGGLWQMGPPSRDGNRLAEAIAHNRGTPLGRTDLSAQIDQTWEASQASAAGSVNPFIAKDPPSEAALKALGAIAANPELHRAEPQKLLVK